MTVVRVSRLLALPPDLDGLAAAAEAEGFGMLATLVAEGFAPFAADGCALFGARDATGGLIGIGGVTRDPWAAALRLRRFYVRPEARGQGVGRDLAIAAIVEARRGTTDRLRLRAPPGAHAFWEAIGFVRIEDDLQATHAMVLGVPA